jgi:hypothetical protein
MEGSDRSLSPGGHDVGKDGVHTISDGGAQCAVASNRIKLAFSNA